MVLDVFAKALAISKVFYRDWYSGFFHKLKSSIFLFLSIIIFLLCINDLREGVISNFVFSDM